MLSFSPPPPRIVTNDHIRTHEQIFCLISLYLLAEIVMFILYTIYFLWNLGYNKIEYKGGNINVGRY